MFRNSCKCFLLVAALALLTLGAASAQDDPAPVFMALRDARLITELALSQTIDDVTVTLDWAYADTQKLIVGYTIAGPDVQTLLPVMSGPNVFLRDTTGSLFSYSGGFAVPGAVVSPNKIVTAVDFYNQAVRPGRAPGTWDVIDDYFHTQFDTLPAAIDLQLEVKLGDYTVPEGMPLTGITAKPGDYVPPVGPFIFDFTVPLYAGITVEPMQTVEAAGLAMTLESLELTPAQAQARFCYDLPDSADWQPDVSLMIDGKAAQIRNSGFTDMNQVYNVERRCMNVAFDAVIAQPHGTVSLTVNALEKSSSEGPQDWERIKAVLAEQDIVIEVEFQQGEGGGGLGIRILSIPDGVDFAEAVRRARETLGDRVPGPWVFNVPF